MYVCADRIFFVDHILLILLIQGLWLRFILAMFVQGGPSIWITTQRRPPGPSLSMWPAPARLLPLPHPLDSHNRHAACPYCAPHPRKQEV